MANLINSHFCSFLSLVILFTTILLIQTESATSERTLFVFGDSLFDAGINQYIENNFLIGPYHRPYGETYFKRPTGRFSDGRVVPDFIAIKAKLPKYLPPYLQRDGQDFSHGANFASAGAAVMGEFEPGRPFNLQAQLGFYKDVVKNLKQKLGEAEANTVLKRAVYLFSIGGNDYFKFSSQHHEGVDEAEQLAYTKAVLGNLTEVLTEVCKLGGRKIAFQNVGPLGCTPGNRPVNSTEKCRELALTVARRHNRLLPLVMEKLEHEFSGFKYSIFDYYHALLVFMDYPSKFGFKVGYSACCGIGVYRASKCGEDQGAIHYELCHDPFEYVWWDGAHTTEAANNLLAELIWDGNHNITAPYTVKQLFESS